MRDKVTIDVRNLRIDPANSMFYLLRRQVGVKALAQDELKREIMADKDTIKLMRSIRNNGVITPLWVVPTENEKYLVIEGNRRACVLQELIEKGVQPPEGISFERVEAYIIEEGLPEDKELMLRTIFQTGTTGFKRVHYAMAIHSLMFKHGMKPEELACSLMISMREVHKQLMCLELYTEYVKETGDEDFQKFALFIDAPSAVMKWVDQAKSNKTKFFELILPRNGTEEARSVRNRRSLRNFGKIVKNPIVLKKFLSNGTITIEDSLELLKNDCA